MVINKYTIEPAYPISNGKYSEVTIKSDNLLYSEVEDLSGCQVRNMDNQKLIHNKCMIIAKMIREIEELNKELK